ncbi:MAG: plasmid maintenance system antidote protein [Paludibacteraceae bacterium]|nr:plasmid maintenance system antidote protein [Paludibacteraceae bacterium]
MDSTISIIKGIHPGIILARELKKRKLAKGSFANSINEFPQTIATISKGKRRMNVGLSLKIEHALGLEEGYFMILQAYNDIEEQKKKLAKNFHPDLSKIRPVVFWDTELKKIDWVKHKIAVINRIFERGNEMEKAEITRFYGNECIESILNPE